MVCNFQINEWSTARELCKNYGNKMRKTEDSQKLREITYSVAKAARKICCKILDHKGIFSYKSVKKPGFVIVLMIHLSCSIQNPIARLLTFAYKTIFLTLLRFYAYFIDNINNIKKILSLIVILSAYSIHVYRYLPTKPLSYESLHFFAFSE